MMETMWCLSLWNPWALLVALGEKRFETRHWLHKHRGPLVIHAAKRWTNEEKYFARQPYFAEALARHDYHINPMPLGCALAVVDLKAIYRVEDIRDRLCPQELAFGNYADGRFAWRLDDVKMFPEPIPLKGEQGLFKVRLPVPA